MAEAVPTPQRAVRLDYIDGVRGLAALYVVLHHAMHQIDNDSSQAPLHTWLKFLQAPLALGSTAVSVFIILSGYCLMLPVARSADGNFRGGLKEYFRRRTRRILPPYYAALFATLALVLLVPALQHPSGRFWDNALPIFSTKDIASHLLVLHNLNPAWFNKIDPPMWSISIEWEIYFFFPILVLIWRRFGIGASTVVGILAGYLVHYWQGGRFDYIQPHYVGLFSLGMAASWLSFSQHKSAASLRRHIPYTLVIAVAMIPTVFVFTHPPHFIQQRAWLRDYVLAIPVMAILTQCAVSTGVLRNMLSHRPIVRLGEFSYSLYLIHFPLQAFLYLGVVHLSASADVRLIAMLLSTLVIVPLAYAFYRCFERPFCATTRPQKSGQMPSALQAEPAGK